MAQDKARSLGEHDGIGVALSGTAKIEALGAERQMRIFGQIIRIDDETVVAVAALVENLRVDNKEASEIGTYLVEFYAPFHGRALGAHTAVQCDFAEFLHHSGAADENLAAVAAVARESVGTEFY